MSIQIRQALANDFSSVSHIIEETAQWLVKINAPMWDEDELNNDVMRSEVAAGLYYVANYDGEPGGTIRYQHEDTQFWPDMPLGEAAYLHRFAVLRKYSGGEVSTALLNWAVQRATLDGKKYLRLDCDSVRPKLKAVYEKYGFCHHSARQVGPYHVARYQIVL